MCNLTWGREDGGRDAYRAKAVELTAQARGELQRAQELEALASSYLRLAEMADRNARTNLIFEPPFSPPVVKQQQVQPNASKTDDGPA